jgi:hypothetical protein
MCYFYFGSVWLQLTIFNNCSCEYFSVNTKFLESSVLFGTYNISIISVIHPALVFVQGPVFHVSHAYLIPEMSWLFITQTGHLFMPVSSGHVL